LDFGGEEVGRMGFWSLVLKRSGDAFVKARHSKSGALIKEAICKIFTHPQKLHVASRPREYKQSEIIKLSFKKLIKLELKRLCQRHLKIETIKLVEFAE